MPFKIFSYTRTVFQNIIYGLNVGTISDKYKVKATPSDNTFGIWGVIYARLLLFVIANPFGDATFDRSMNLNVQWMKLWNKEDLQKAHNTIDELSDVNNSLVCNYLQRRQRGWHLDTLDIYATWVMLASVLNAWVVRVYVKGQDDRSRDAVKSLIKSMDTTRPGVRYTINRFKKGVDWL